MRIPGLSPFSPATQAGQAEYEKQTAPFPPKTQGGKWPSNWVTRGF